MALMKVELCIGYPTAKHSDVIDVDDEELEECLSDEEIQKVCYEYWKEWANNYIEADFKLIRLDEDGH